MEGERGERVRERDREEQREGEREREGERKNTLSVLNKLQIFQQNKQIDYSIVSRSL